MRNIYKRYRFLLFPVLVIVAMVVGTLFVLIPQAQALLTNYNEVQSLTKKNADLSAKRQVLESVNKPKLLGDIALATETLPDDKDLSSLLLTIENVAQRSQLDLDTISLTPGALSTPSAAVKSTAPVGEVLKRRGSQALRVSASVRGTTDALKSFLGVMTRSRRLFDIESIDITYQVEETDSIRANVVLLAYYLPAITSIGGVDAPIAPITPMDQTTLTQLSTFPSMGKVPSGETSTSTQQLPVGKPDLFN